MSISTVPLGPRTTALLERLRRVDPAAGEVNRCRAARAVALHLERFGLPARPPRWADDGPSFIAELLSAGWALHLQSSTGAGPLKVPHRSLLLARLSPRVQDATWDKAYASALYERTSGPHECRHGLPPREETPAEAAGRAASEALRNLPAFGEFSARWATADDAARRLLLPAGIPEGGPDFDHALAAMTQIGGMLRPSPADLAAQYLSDLAAAESLGVAESLGALEPMIDALESGLWHFWPTATETILVARPAMRFVGADLHDEKAPAVLWSGAASYWFLFGQRVDRGVVESPATLDPACVERESMPYRRGILIRQYGLDRYLRAAQGTIVNESPAGRLIRFGSFALVEVRRTPAGFPAEYIRVPATVTTPEEGLAWTSGLTAAEYSRDKDRSIRGPYSPREMGPAARGLIDRLSRVNRKNPVVDRFTAEAAFARRFGSVDRGKAQIDWISGRQAEVLTEEQFCKGHELGDREEEEPYAESLGEASCAARLACDAEAERTALHALEAAHAQIQVTEKACEAVGVAAARYQGMISLSDDVFGKFWMPWVLLYEAGAGMLWTEPGTIHVLQRPALRIVDGLLDDDDDPSVAWPGGPELRYRRGVRVGE